MLPASNPERNAHAASEKVEAREETKDTEALGGTLDTSGPSASDLRCSFLVGVSSPRSIAEKVGRLFSSSTYMPRTHVFRFPYHQELIPWAVRKLNQSGD